MILVVLLFAVWGVTLLFGTLWVVDTDWPSKRYRVRLTRALSYNKRGPAGPITKRNSGPHNS